MSDLYTEEAHCTSGNIQKSLDYGDYTHTHYRVNFPTGEVVCVRLVKNKLPLILICYHLKKKKLLKVKQSYSAYCCYRKKY